MKTTLVLAALAFGALVSLAPGQQMSYQGRITDNTGAPVPGNQSTLVFTIWDAPTGGNSVWGPFTRNVDLIDSRFSIKLGDATGNDGNENILAESFGGQRYIQVQVGSDSPLPRQEVLSSPTALSASTLSDSSNTIAYARNGFFEVPSVSSFGSAFTPTLTEQTNLMNILSGNNTDGGTNGITFFENANFGMSLGYDGSGAGVTNALRIYDNSDAALFSFEHGGELGIGTTTPAAPLDVNGRALFNGFTSDGTSAVNGTLSVSSTLDANGSLDVDGFSNLDGFLSNGNSGVNGRLALNRASPSNVTFAVQALPGDNIPIDFVNSAGETMLQQLDSGNFFIFGNAFKNQGGTSWSTFSDRNLKEKVLPYEKGLNEIMQLETVRFHYKENKELGFNSSEAHIGFIAQDVQKVFPEAVSTVRDYLNVNVDPIHWAAINAIQELNDRVESQETTIATQTAENAALKTRLAELEQQFGTLIQTVETLKSPVDEAKEVSLVK